jgi:hypothetical protein
MVRELPLLLGAIGTVLGLFSLPWAFFSLSTYAHYFGYAPPLPIELSALAWGVGPFLALAGDFKVKEHGKLGGLLFLAAGAFPWLGISTIFGWWAIYWTPLLVIAGVLAILNWPGPYVDNDEMADRAEEGPSTE